MVVCFGGCLYPNLQFFGRLWWTGRFAESFSRHFQTMIPEGNHQSLWGGFFFNRLNFAAKKYWSFWDWSKWSYIPGIVITVFGVLKCQVGSLILWENHSQRVKLVCEHVFQPNQTSGFGCLIFLMVFSLQPHDIVRTSPMWRVVLSSNRVYVPVFSPIDGRLEAG